MADFINENKTAEKRGGSCCCETQMEGACCGGCETRRGGACCGGCAATLRKYRRGMKIFIDDIMQMSESVDGKAQLEKFWSMETLKRRVPIIRWLPKYRYY